MGKISRALTKAETPEQHDQVKPDAVGDESAAPSSPAGASFAPLPLWEGVPPTKAAESTPEWNERLVTATETFSGVAESFRKLRTLILHPEEGQPPRSILVVSTDPQEGKSFACANLGITLARDLGHRALMIDCDLRRPSLHTLFGLQNNHGLADYLCNGGQPADHLLPTGLANLSLLPAGPPPKNPAELVSSARMADLIKAIVLGNEHYLLLLDSAPFLAAAETYVLSQLVDKVVLVVRWGRAGRENVKKVAEQIGREKIIGVVFNAFETNILDRRIQGVGYHNYYSESYY
jgi:capsular exopolysaccharide synthesis family protein